MKPIKILLLSTSSSRNAGGLYNSVRFLGKSLSKIKGLFPIIMAFNDNKSKEDNKTYHPVKLQTYNIIGPAGIGFSFDLNRNIHNINPDIIHIQGIWLFSSLLNFKYSSKNNKPYIVTPRGMLDPWILSQRSWKKKLGLFLYERKHLMNATCLHALCLPEYEAIRKFGLNQPVAIIPNGVNIPQPVNPESNIRPKWHDDKKNHMLFLSRIHPKKNLLNLLKAWKIANPKNWKLIIAGETKDRHYLNDLNNYITNNNLSNDIEFIGGQYHQNKDTALRLSDAFILPSHSEGMPMAILEAWSYSLPVIMTKECNIPSGFEKNAAIEVGQSAQDIAHGISEVCKLDKEKLNQIGMNGLRLVEEKYTWDKIASQVQEMYKWCLKPNYPLPHFIYLD